MRYFVSISLALAALVCIVLIGRNTEDFPEYDAFGKNILGTELELCSKEPLTGFYRDGYCTTGYNDRGIHVVCAKVDMAFLEYSKSQGNDLITPFPEFNFPGLKEGDKWCLCAARWKEAMKAGKAPKVLPASTNIKALDIIEKEILLEHSK